MSMIIQLMLILSGEGLLMHVAVLLQKATGLLALRCHCLRSLREKTRENDSGGIYQDTRECAGRDRVSCRMTVCLKRTLKSLESTKGESVRRSSNRAAEVFCTQTAPPSKADKQGRNYRSLCAPALTRLTGLTCVREVKEVGVISCVNISSMRVMGILARRLIVMMTQCAQEVVSMQREGLA